MLSAIFLIAGLYMVFKKEIKISSKRVIKGKIPQRIGLVFVISGLLPSVIKLIPESPISVMLEYVSIASFVIAFLSIFYFIFFYKSAENKNNNRISSVKTESSEIFEEQKKRNIISKLFFPFFNKNRHEFLTKKWWFRSIVVIFITVFVISIPSLWFIEINNVYNNCDQNARSWWGGGKIPTLDPENIKESLENVNGYYDSLHNCNNLAEPWRRMGLIPAIIIPTIIFYLFQLIFFKIIINYIVLGGKN